MTLIEKEEAMKRNHLTWTLAAAATAVLVLLLVAPAAQASNAIAKKEGDMVCTACHDKPGSKLLTDQGKYYELMGDLAGFDALQAEFSKCTRCHVRKPGSSKLTDTGRRYQWMMQDMEGIKGWLLERHPATGAKPTSGES